MRHVGDKKPFCCCYNALERMHTEAPLPDGYISPMDWPEFINIATVPSFLKPKRLNTLSDSAWRLWPFSVESYHSDTEPDLSAPAPFPMPFRIVMWQRKSYATARPKGWVALRRRPECITGFLHITGRTQYDEHWSDSARRDKKLFRTRYAQDYRIETASYREFADAYVRGTIKPILKQLLLRGTLEPHVEKNPEQTTLWVARRNADNKIVAGLASLDSPTSSASYYLAGFYLKEVKMVPLMTALVDTWCSTSQRKGMRFLHFGLFYQRGDPRSWKGYSNFKAKFGIQYVARPPVLYTVRRR